MKVHPVAELFPMMGEAELASLAADIKQHGLLNPITVDREDRILDGRNRMRACEQAGVKLVTEIFAGADPLSFIISQNLHRRHLTVSQRAAIADHLAMMSHGGDRKSEEIKSQKCELISREDAAAKMRVSPRALDQARSIRVRAPEVAKKVESGEITLAEATRELKERGRQAKRTADAAKVEHAETPEDIIVTGAHFTTIVIDPPWDWGDEGDVDQLGRAKPTYATMPMEELLDLPIGDLAASDAHLYLWITNRSLPKGFNLLDKWGFRYITCLTWCKPGIGMGNHFRGSTEHILFGIRGSLPLNRKDVGTWFQAPRGKEHSAKPEAFYELVESCSPGPYLDMFSRRERKGWKCWGNK